MITEKDIGEHLYTNRSVLAYDSSIFTPEFFLRQDGYYGTSYAIGTIPFDKRKEVSPKIQDEYLNRYHLMPLNKYNQIVSMDNDQQKIKFVIDHFLDKIADCLVQSASFDIADLTAPVVITNTLAAALVYPKNTLITNELLNKDLTLLQHCDCFNDNYSKIPDLVGYILGSYLRMVKGSGVVLPKTKEELRVNPFILEVISKFQQAIINLYQGAAL